MNIRDLSYSRHFLVVSDGQEFPSRAMECALQFARGFSKGLTLLSINETVSDAYRSAVAAVDTTGVNFIDAAADCTFDDLVEMSERTETPIMFFGVTKSGFFSRTMRIFEGLRDLRIPFVLVKHNCEEINLSKILVPVAYLTEEKEKAPYSSNMGRFLKSEIVVLQANDYGTKAARNVEAITKLYDKFELKYEVRKARKNSFKVEMEAARMARGEHAGMVVISTSRDYGLDDIIFGPKEKHIVSAATTPVMCINPRGDLYVLCW